MLRVIPYTSEAVPLTYFFPKKCADAPANTIYEKQVINIKEKIKAALSWCLRRMANVLAIGILHFFLVGILLDTGNISDIAELRNFSDHMAFLLISIIIILLKMMLKEHYIFTLIGSTCILPFLWQLVYKFLPWRTTNSMVMLTLIIIGTYFSLALFLVIYALDKVKFSKAKEFFNDYTVIVMLFFGFVTAISVYFLMAKIQINFTGLECTYLAALSPGIANIVFLTALNRKYGVENNNDKKAEDETIAADKGKAAVNAENENQK